MATTVYERELSLPLGYCCSVASDASSIKHLLAFLSTVLLFSPFLS